MRERLRSARQAMHERFPLTESLWFDWINDELEDVSDADDIPRLQELFETAVKDYFSLAIWLQYVE